MNDFRNELLTYTKEQLVELQGLLYKKLRRIESEIYMTSSPDKLVSWRYNKAVAELAITKEVLKLKQDV